MNDKKFEVHPKLKNFAAAMLSYRSDFTDLIPSIFPEAKFHFYRHPNGAFYHGVIIEEKTGIIRKVFRGTDGDNVIGKAQAWLANINIITGADGIVNGCQNVVEDFLKRYGCYYSDSQQSESIGHSQGTICAKIDALFTAEQYKNIDVSIFETYADFPAGDERFLARVQIQEQAGRLFGTRYTVRGDPAEAKEMRNPHNPLLDGEDIGVKGSIPDVLGPHATSLLGLFAHSPRAFCFAKMWEEIRKKEIGNKIDDEYLQSLSWILWRVKN